MGIRGLGFLAAGLLTSLGCSGPADDGLPPLLGGGGNDASGSSSSVVSSTGSGAVTSSSSTGVMAPPCDPPAEPGSFWAQADSPYYPPLDPIGMCAYRGEVVLVVNTAAA